MAVADRKLIISQSLETAMEFLAEADGGFCRRGKSEGDQEADAGDL